MNKLRLRSLIAKSFLGVAYLSVVLEWLWVLIISLPLLIKNGALDKLHPTPGAAGPVIHMPAIEPSPITWIVVGLITLLMCVVTIIVIFRLPRAFVNGSERIVEQAVAAAVPVVTHHRPLPAKKRRTLSHRLTLALQVILSATPVVICLFIPPFEELTFQIIIAIALWLGTISLIMFALAYVIRPPQLTSRTRSRASRG